MILHGGRPAKTGNAPLASPLRFPIEATGDHAVKSGLTTDFPFADRRSMSRIYVNQLNDGQNVDGVFRASEKQLRPNRAGNLYLQVRLSDRTGPR